MCTGLKLIKLPLVKKYDVVHSFSTGHRYVVDSYFKKKIICFNYLILLRNTIIKYNYITRLFYTR